LTDIREILQRRTDLSTFLVHLTRAGESETAEDRLKSILQSGRIEARTPMGAAAARLSRDGLDTGGQKCVCFTETPLEVVHCAFHSSRTPVPLKPIASIASSAM